MTVWYRVRDLDAGRAFYRDQLGFTETYFDARGRWSRLEHGNMEIALWEAGEDEGGVASIEVADVRKEADRLREAGVEVGVVLELSGQMRLLDVFDPDGNRVQLTEDVR